MSSQVKILDMDWTCQSMLNLFPNITLIFYVFELYLDAWLEFLQIVASFPHQEHFTMNKSPILKHSKNDQPGKKNIYIIVEDKDFFTAPSLFQFSQSSF